MVLKAFKFRGNYLNFNVVQQFLNGDIDKDKCYLPGYLPVEMDYQLMSGESGSLHLTHCESVYLCMNPAPLRHDILENILSARQDAEAAKRLTNQIHDFIADKRMEFQNLNFVENESIVPSCTQNMFDGDLISHKGTKLLDIIQEGYPVPDFCILTSNNYFLSQEERKANIYNAIKNLEQMSAQKFGSEDKPLIIAMRSAMPSYIPGLMPTFLNVGVTSNNFPALSKILGKTVAKKIYLSNLRTLELNLFGGYETEQNIEVDRIDEEIDYHYERICVQDERLLHDAFYQVCFFLRRAYEYFEKNQDLLHTFVRKGEKFPSVILQKMVWTVRGDESYPGVLYSRHARTGLGIQVESLPNIFGEEIMTGLIETNDHEFFDRESIKNMYPAVYHFEPLLQELEKKLKSPVTVEFAAESYDDAYLFAVLQLNTSELTGRATLLSATDLYQKKVIDAERVIELIKPYHLTQIFSDRIDDRSFKTLKFFCKGVSILPRTAAVSYTHLRAHET